MDSRLILQLVLLVKSAKFRILCEFHLSFYRKAITEKNHDEMS